MSIDSMFYEQNEKNKQMDAAVLGIQKKNREKEERDIQDSRNLERIADYNEMMLKLLSNDLTFINRALEKNNESNVESKALLLQLTTIIEEQDEKQLSDFMKQQGMLALATGVCAYIKNKLNIPVG